MAYFLLSWFWSMQSIIRVVFHDRRLQYTEHQQLEGWRWNRPGDRILDLGEYYDLRYSPAFAISELVSAVHILITYYNKHQ